MIYANDFYSDLERHTLMLSNRLQSIFFVFTISLRFFYKKLLVLFKITPVELRNRKNVFHRKISYFTENFEKSRFHCHIHPFLFIGKWFILIRKYSQTNELTLRKHYITRFFLQAIFFSDQAQLLCCLAKSKIP